MQGGERVILELDGNEKQIKEVFKSFPEVTGVNIGKIGDLFRVEVESKKDLRREFAQALVGKKIGLLEMQLDKVTLEDIFLDLTTKEEAA
jgi:hypothetical protein